MPLGEGVARDARQRACRALRHVDMGTVGCPCTDDDLVEQLSARVGELTALVEALHLPEETR